MCRSVDSSLPVVWPPMVFLPNCCTAHREPWDRSSPRLDIPAMHCLHTSPVNDAKLAARLICRYQYEPGLHRSSPHLDTPPPPCLHASPLNTLSANPLDPSISFPLWGILQGLNRIASPYCKASRKTDLSIPIRTRTSQRCRLSGVSAKDYRSNRNSMQPRRE